MSMPADYPRPGAWADDPEHAQTLVAILERGSPGQVADLEAEALRSVADHGEALLGEDPTAYADGWADGMHHASEAGEDDYFDGYDDGYDAGFDNGYEQAQVDEQKRRETAGKGQT